MVKRLYTHQEEEDDLTQKKQEEQTKRKGFSKIQNDGKNKVNPSQQHPPQKKTKKLEENKPKRRNPPGHHSIIIIIRYTHTQSHIERAAYLHNKWSRPVDSPPHRLPSLLHNNINNINNSKRFFIYIRSRLVLFCFVLFFPLFDSFSI